MVTQPVVSTNVGELRFDSVSYTVLSAGPGGCLNGLQIGFEDSVSIRSCDLTLTAEMVGERLVVSSVQGVLDGCDGYAGDGFGVSEDDPASIPFELGFEGTTCGGNDEYDDLCFAGKFDWHLHGTVDGVSFQDQHLIAEGVECTYDSGGRCPAP